MCTLSWFKYWWNDDDGCFNYCEIENLVWILMLPATLLTEIRCQKYVNISRDAEAVVLTTQWEYAKVLVE
jgi:hypothetical protein